MSIEYIALTGAPPYVTAYLEPVDTIEDLWAYSKSLQADLDSIEDQLNGFERFGYWPKVTGKWESAEAWLDNTLGARHSRKWMLSIVKATLSWHYRTTKMSQIEASINRLFEENINLKVELEKEIAKRVSAIENVVGRIKNTQKTVESGDYVSKINRLERLVEEEKTKRVNNYESLLQDMKRILRVLYDNGMIPEGPNHTAIEGAIAKDPDWGIWTD
jgi:hypothetical protein